jgi:hypothetical protein
MGSVVEWLCQKIGRAGPGRGQFATQSALDNLLPDKQFRRGTLVEWFGGTTLAAISAHKALREAGAVVVVDSAKNFYPPAAARLGFDLKRLVIARPTADDHDWLVHQALACPAIDAVLCWPAKLHAKMFRRWQLAAEGGGSIGMLVRPASARGRPSWADLQLLVTGNRHLRVEVVRGRTAGRWAEIEVDEEGNIHDRLPVAAQLADAAIVSGSA